MQRSLDWRHMAWRVLGRWCRPNVDTFFTLLLFSAGGTLLTVLWTFEPRPVDERAAEEEVQRQLVEEFIREKEQLRKELDRLNSSYSNDLRLLNDPHAVASPKRQTHFDTGSNDKPPEVVFRNRTRTPKRNVGLSVNRSASVLTGGTKLGNDRALSVNSSDVFLQNYRVKLLATKPEVDQRSRQPVFRDGGNDSLVGSRRWCSVYNTTPEVDESFDCIRLLIKPPTTVCLHPDPVDIHVSRHLRQDGLWEPHIVRLLQNLLFQNPDLGLIDIGAHIGQYSLLAASMGRRVVAVEPHRASLQRLHKAVKINNVEKQVR